MVVDRCIEVMLFLVGDIMCLGVGECFECASSMLAARATGCIPVGMSRVRLTVNCGARLP